MLKKMYFKKIVSRTHNGANVILPYCLTCHHGRERLGQIIRDGSTYFVTCGGLVGTVPIAVKELDGLLDVRVHGPSPLHFCEWLLRVVKGFQEKVINHFLKEF